VPSLLSFGCHAVCESILESFEQADLDGIAISAGARQLKFTVGISGADWQSLIVLRPLCMRVTHMVVTIVPGIRNITFHTALRLRNKKTNGGTSATVATTNQTKP